LAEHHQTEANWRLCTTLLRFDVVSVGRFKSNLRCVADYPSLSGCLRDPYQVLGVADTVDMRRIKGTTIRHRRRRASDGLTLPHGRN
jgi:putative glutathione S-transferase